MHARAPSLLELALYGAAALAFVASLSLGPPSTPAFEPGPRAPDVLRIVSWNVGGASGHFADLDLEHVAATLSELEPDVVVLQEIARFGQGRELERRLGPSWSSLMAPGTGARVILLVRGADFTAFPIPGVSDAPERKARALGVVLRPRTNGKVFGHGAVTVVGVHADAYAAEERNALLGAACDELLARAGAGPRLLLGDFNLDLDLDKRGDLFSDDSYLDVETYNYVAAVLQDCARGNGSTAEPDRRLDYVFCDERSFEVLAAGPWKGRRGPDMDHDPVVADLSPRD